MARRAPAAVAGLPVYRPGRRRAAVPGLTRYKLSSNENPYPPLPGVLAAAATACAQMNRYPDLANAGLTEAVAARLGVSGERLAFGTGSVAVLYHLLRPSASRGTRWSTPGAASRPTRSPPSSPGRPACRCRWRPGACTI